MLRNDISTSDVSTWQFINVGLFMFLAVPLMVTIIGIPFVIWWWSKMN